MPSSQKTPLGLNQWQTNDVPDFDDHNADNLIVDSALGDLKIRSIPSVISFTRDLTLVGDYILTIPRKVQGINSMAIISGTASISHGMYGSASDQQSTIWLRPFTNVYLNSPSYLNVLESSIQYRYTTVRIINIGDDKITLNFAHSTSGSAEGTGIFFLSYTF